MNSHLKTITRLLVRPVVRSAAATILLLSVGSLAVVQSIAAEAPGVMAEEGAEVLTRGPVHEAFAETVSFKPVKGTFVSKAPPAVVEELPPDQRPDGTNVTWIPGYWAWDDEGSEFLWVSGIWRNLPPGRQWIPGYWSEAGAEYQWVSGYWGDAAAEEVEYLPEPPVSIEAGPNIRRPSVDHSWMPGSWIWYQSNYSWRPGYWEVVRPDWMWVPSYYTWSPYGYIYVDGYYDYAVARRGMIFAPVRFHAGYYAQHGYYYRPYAVINMGLLIDHLFLRPRHCHYYFGDYYAPEYRRHGYYSCHSYYSGGYGYDPIFAHARWSHRHDDRWERRYEENYAFYRDNSGERPPRTLAAFQRFAGQPDSKRRVNSGLVAPISTLAESRGSAAGLRTVNEDERKKFAQRGREIRDFGDQRRKLASSSTGNITDTVESQDARPGKGKSGRGEAGKQEPVRMKIPRSPAVAQVTEESAKENVPPKRREFTMPEGKSGGKSAANRRDGVNTEPTAGDETGRKSKGGSADQAKTEPNMPEGKSAASRRAGVNTEPTPDAQPGDETGRKSKGGSADQTKTEPKVNPRREPGETTAPEPRAEPKDSRKREPKSEPNVPRTEPKSEPRREPNVEPKREPKAQPSRKESVVEPKREPKREPRVEPKAEPRRESRPVSPREMTVQSKRETKVEVRRAPTVQPRVQPKSEPRRAAPTVQPRAQPQPAPRPAPTAQPKAQPKRESSDKEKDKSRGR